MLAMMEPALLSLWAAVLWLETVGVEGCEGPASQFQRKLRHHRFDQRLPEPGASQVGLVVGISACSAGDPRTWVQSWVEKVPEGKMVATPVFCWRNSMDGGAWRATLHGHALPEPRVNFLINFTAQDHASLVRSLSS